MKSTIEELGPTRVRMAIEVPWGDLDHAFGEVYKELGRQVRVPGFRPGKVPNRVLDQRIGRPIVLEQVVQHAIPEVYSEVVRENQVRVLGQPDIEVTRLDDNDTLAFTAEVDVSPKIELPSLEDLAAPVDGYDGFTIAQLRGRMRGYQLATVQDLLAYEEATRAREPFLRMLRNRLEKLERQAAENSPLAPRGA